MRAVLGSQAGHQPAWSEGALALAGQARRMHKVQTAQRACLKRRVGQQPPDSVPVQAANGQLQVRIQAVQAALRVPAEKAGEVRPVRRSRRSQCCRLRARCLRFMPGRTWCMNMNSHQKDQQVSQKNISPALKTGLSKKVCYGM